MRWNRYLLIPLLCTATMFSNAADRKIVVGFVQDTLANDWRLNQVMELKRALQDVPNIEFVYVDAHGSAARQMLETENMISRGVDILVSSPRDPAIMTPVLSRAYKQGISVILLTRGINNQDYTTFIAPDDEAIARQSAQYLALRLKGRGRVLMIRGVATATTAKLRTSGFVDELRKFPGIQLVATIEGNYQRQDTIYAMERLLASGPGFDAIYAQSDSMAAGARLVLKKKGIDPGRFVTLGIDYINEAREAIRIGEQDASITYPTCAEEAGDVIKRIVAGKKVRKNIRVASQIVTKANVEKVVPIF